MSDERDNKQVTTATAIAVAPDEQPETKQQVIRLDRNFVKYPVFVSSQYKGKSRSVVVTKKLNDGSIIQRKLLIGLTARGHEIGFFTSTHERVLSVLNYFWQRAGKPIDTPVACTLYDICTKLGWQWGRWQQKYLEKTLHDLRQIPITWENSFWRAKDKEYLRLLRDFSILTSLGFVELRKGNKKYHQVQFEINKLSLENMGKLYSFPLRLESYLKLKKEIASLLYPYIERALAYNTKFEWGLEKLWDDLGLSKKYIRSPSDYKTTITPAMEELEGAEFYWGTLAFARVEVNQRGTGYKAVFTKKFPAVGEEGQEKQCNAVRERTPVKSQDYRPLNRYEKMLINEAVKLGIAHHRKSAEKLLRRHGYAELKKFVAEIHRNKKIAP